MITAGLENRGELLFYEGSNAFSKNKNYILQTGETGTSKLWFSWGKSGFLMVYGSGGKVEIITENSINLNAYYETKAIITFILPFSLLVSWF